MLEKYTPVLLTLLLLPSSSSIVLISKTHVLERVLNTLASHLSIAAIKHQWVWHVRTEVSGVSCLVSCVPGPEERGKYFISTSDTSKRLTHMIAQFNDTQLHHIIEIMSRGESVKSELFQNYFKSIFVSIQHLNVSNHWMSFCLMLPGDIHPWQLCWTPCIPCPPLPSTLYYFVQE